MNLYQKLVIAVGGKSHLSFLLAFIVITTAYFVYPTCSNFSIFALTISSLCGIQTTRSILSDKYPGNTNTGA